MEPTGLKGGRKCWNPYYFWMKLPFVSFVHFLCLLFCVFVCFVCLFVCFVGWFGLFCTVIDNHLPINLL
jgi:hypothetical protein